MNYKVEEKYNCVIIHLKGKITGGPAADEFRDLLHELIDEDKTSVIVDLGKVSFMNSSGIGILIGGLTTMRNAGGDLRICQAQDRIQNLLVVTELITVFEHYSTLEEAINSYQEEAKEEESTE